MDAVWQRLPNESAPAYEAFACYRDMGGERSIAKVSAQLGKSGALLHRWSSPARHSWVARSEAYDRHIARETEVRTERIAVMSKVEARTRRIAVSQTLLSKSAEALLKKKPDDFTLHDAMRGIAIALDQLRRDYDDEPTHKIEGELTRIVAYFPANNRHPKEGGKMELIKGNGHVRNGSPGSSNGTPTGEAGTVPGE